MYNYPRLPWCPPSKLLAPVDHAASQVANHGRPFNVTEVGDWLGADVFPFFGPSFRCVRPSQSVTGGWGGGQGGGSLGQD